MARDPSEEVTPLLNTVPAPAYQPEIPSPYPPPGYNAQGYNPNYATAPYTQPAPHPPSSAFPPTLSSLSSPPPSSSMYPPPHPSSSMYPPVPVSVSPSIAEVPCRVCSRPIQFSTEKKMSAVKCNICDHATQVGPPPVGKTFILCQCNTLLTVPVTAKAATCPKVNCKKTLILAPEDPGKTRAFCSHCSTLLTYKSVSAVVICPKCRGRSVVSRPKLHWYIGFNVMIGLLFLFLGLFFTLGSYEASGGGFYFVFWGFGLAGILSLIRAVVYISLNWRAKDAVAVPNPV